MMEFWNDACLCVAHRQGFKGISLIELQPVTAPNLANRCLHPDENRGEGQQSLPDITSCARKITCPARSLLG